jgi:hypothetical protein
VNEAVCAGRPDGLFVKVHGIERAAFEARDLGAYQRRAVFEILRAIFCPYFQLSVVRRQSLEVLPSLPSFCGIAGCRLRKRPIKVVLRRSKK